MKKTVWLCALLLAAMRVFSAQAPSPVPAAEQQAKGWLAAFNSGDRATLLEFLQKYRRNVQVVGVVIDDAETARAAMPAC